MIQIKANTNGEENSVDVRLIVHGDEKSVTKELFYVLKALDDRFPKLLMNAVDMHINDICDEIMEEGGDDD